MQKKTTIIIVAALLLPALLAGGALLALYWFATAPAAAEGAVQIVVVPPGQGLKTTAAGLYAQGIISSATKFSLYARLKGYDKRLKAGEYELSSVYSPEKILDIIVNGKVRLHRLTIPEGFNLAQIAEMMPAVELGTADTFLAAANDTDLARRLNIPGESFEGYLFPDTYHFPRGVSPEKMIQTMVRRFRQVFTDAWEARARERNLTVHQVVTLASIIEKETGEPSERPLISSVFHNRLQRGMRLASDPTVIYGIKDFDGNLTRRDLTTWSPYNTYKISGLPPGPIANPGSGSLQAALYPAETDYLYFVSRKDGTHQFSKTYEAHDRAVKKYQLRR